MQLLFSSKRFQPGEKVTFSQDEHLCHTCLKLEPSIRAISRDDGPHAASSVTKSDTALFDSSVSAASGDVGLRSAHLNRLSTSQSADRSMFEWTIKLFERFAYDCIVLYSSIYIPPLNSHGPTEGVLV